MSETTYSGDFWAGVQASVDLLRAGAEVDQLQQIIPGGGPVGLDGYHQHLRELRILLGIDRPELFGGDDGRT